MIDFKCEKCGQKFSIPESKAGKKGKCPRCKNVLVIPEPESTSQTSRYGDSDNSRYSAYDLSLLDIPQKNESQNQQINQYEISGKATGQAQQFRGKPFQGKHESGTKRKYSWPVDIFLYPTSKGGLSTITVIILLRILTDFVTFFGICCVFVGILGLIAKVFIVYSYMYWYFSKCIRDSAAGEVRAPEIEGNISGLNDMFRQLIILLVCYAFTFGPVTFYRGYTYLNEIEMNATVFWPLLTYGIFFFPMGALAAIMFDSVDGLNPILLLRSIYRTLVEYCGLVLLFYGLGILFYILRSIIVSNMHTKGIIPYNFVFYIFLNIFTIYSLLIFGHLLGRFYWKYQEKLNWNI